MDVTGRGASKSEPGRMVRREYDSRWTETTFAPMPSSCRQLADERARNTRSAIAKPCPGALIKVTTTCRAMPTSHHFRGETAEDSRSQDICRCDNSGGGLECPDKSASST